LATKLTDIAVRKLKAGAVRREVADGTSGLRLIIQPSGARSWCVRYRYQSRTCKLTLGSAPPLTLAEARAQAAAALAKVKAGTDPAVERRQAKAKAVDRAGDTVERLAALFLDQHARVKTRQSSWRHVEGTFRREVLPRWRGRQITDIGRRDIREIIRAIAATRPIMANRALAHLSRFFKWCVNEDYITGSPCVGIERPAPENVRDRALSDDEVRQFWAATDTLPTPFNDIYKLLLLSGARRQEIAELQWRELDLARKVWTLPSERSKSRLAHMLPLSPMAWRIIEAQPRIVGSDYVFGSRRTGFAHMKSRLDSAMHADVPWRNHDLRRTSRSLLSRARVASDVAELMLGHLLPGMRRVYDRHKYLDEKRDGFAALEREIDLILHPLDGRKIVRLARS
jgi:integrase